MPHVTPRIDPRGLGQRATASALAGSSGSILPAHSGRTAAGQGRLRVRGAWVTWCRAAAYLRGSSKACERQGRPSAASEGQSAGRTRQ